MRTGVFHETFASEERLWDSTTAQRWMLAFTLALFTLPLWGTDYVLAMACIIGIHVIATLGLNITTGNAGLISLSHGAFLGVGCYTVAWLAKQGVPFYLTLPAAGFVTAALGVIVGLPSLRVKGLYLAIATLAAHFILTFVFREWEPVTGGVPGTSIPSATLVRLRAHRRPPPLLPDLRLRVRDGRGRAQPRPHPHRPRLRRRARPRHLGRDPRREPAADQAARVRHRRLLRRRGRRAARLLLWRHHARVLRADAVGFLPGRRHRRRARFRARQHPRRPVHDLRARGAATRRARELAVVSGRRRSAAADGAGRVRPADHRVPRLRAAWPRRDLVAHPAHFPPLAHSGPEYSVRRPTISIPMETTMANLVRRKLVQSIGAAASLGPFAIGPSYGAGPQGRHRDRRLAADHRDLLVRRRGPEQRTERLRAVEEREGRRDGPQAALRLRGQRLQARPGRGDLQEDHGGGQALVLLRRQHAVGEGDFEGRDRIELGHDLVAVPRRGGGRPGEHAAALRARTHVPAAARDPDGVHRAGSARRGDQAEHRLRVCRHRVRSRRHPGRQGARGEARPADRRRDRDQAGGHRRRARGCEAAPREARHRDLPGLHRRADARVRAPDARGGLEPADHGHGLGSRQAGLRRAGRPRCAADRREHVPLRPRDRCADDQRDARIPGRRAAGREAHLAVLHLELALRHDLRGDRRALHQGREAVAAAAHAAPRSNR